MQTVRVPRDKMRHALCFSRPQSISHSPYSRWQAPAENTAEPRRLPEHLRHANDSKQHRKPYPYPFVFHLQFLQLGRNGFPFIHFCGEFSSQASFRSSARAACRNPMPRPPSAVRGRTTGFPAAEISRSSVFSSFCRFLVPPVRLASQAAWAHRPASAQRPFSSWAPVQEPFPAVRRRPWLASQRNALYEPIKSVRVTVFEIQHAGCKALDEVTVMRNKQQRAVECPQPPPQSTRGMQGQGGWSAHRG